MTGHPRGRRAVIAWLAWFVSLQTLGNALHTDWLVAWAASIAAGVLAWLLTAPNVPLEQQANEPIWDRAGAQLRQQPHVNQ